MSSYDDPSAGHKTAVRQLAESRSQVLSLIRQLNSGGMSATGPHVNLIPVGEAPNARTVATASLADYILQLRPYRHHSDHWAESLGSITLPNRFPAPKPRSPSEDRFFTIDGSAEIAVDTLSSVMDLAGLTISYSAPKVGKNTFGRDTREFLFALTSRQIRGLFATADDVAADGDFLADLTEPDTTDKSGW